MDLIKELESQQLKKEIDVYKRQAQTRTGSTM